MDGMSRVHESEPKKMEHRCQSRKSKLSRKIDSSSLDETNRSKAKSSCFKLGPFLMLRSPTNSNNLCFTLRIYQYPNDYQTKQIKLCSQGGYDNVCKLHVDL